MEQHGNNHQQKVYAIIPARYESTRLPGKLLLEISGKPLILHTLEQAKKAKNIDQAIVATDSEKILQVVKASGHDAVLTSENHQSGSDRIAEVAANLPENSIVVNVQGDEPTISPTTIEKAVEAILADESADIATTCEKIEDIRDVLSPDVVKVVTDKNGYALYFSRSPIPFPREAVKKHGTLEKALRNEPELISLFRKHTGLYVYRREFLLKFTQLEQTHLEKTEMLEQLRALENGARIKVVEVEESSIGVDTAEDFERVKDLIEEINKQISTDRFILRQAKLNDLPFIERVLIVTSQNSFQQILPQTYLNSFSEGQRYEDFENSSLCNNNQIFIAENVYGEIVGYLDFKEMPKGGPFDCFITALYVLPEYQRKGIGSRLFNLAIEEMISRGKKTIVLEALEVSSFNSFYEKKNGKIIGFSYHKHDEKDYKTLVYGWGDLTQIETRQKTTPNFIYRQATIEDVPGVAKVHVESWQKSFNGIAPQNYLDNISIEQREKAFSERFFDEDYRMFVAESPTGEIVGFVDFGKARHEISGYEVELFAIYLLSELKGKGLGAELFKIGVKDLMARGFNSMYLQALKLSPYKNFYEKMGGKIIGESIYKLGDEDFETYYYGWEDLDRICRIG